MKVLITGATAQQASQKTALRVPTFASLMAQSLSEAGAAVNFTEPSIEMDKRYLADYDVVLVGVAPPTSLSANKLYPAFAIANRAREIGNLALFLDAPEPFKLQASLKSCYLNISDLQKGFYSRRKNYEEMTSNSEFSTEVYSFIEFLYKRPWPVTLYSALPWSHPGAITSVIPNIDESRLFGVNLDVQILKDSNNIATSDKQETFWTCDAPKTKWSVAIKQTLQYPIIPIRENKWEDRSQIGTRMSNSIGTLISVHRALEPWWSPFVAQSLALGKPVVTDWRYSSVLGSAWSHLASTVEEMSPSERAQLAQEQKVAYLASLPGRTQTDITKALDMAASAVFFTHN
jgi:hypothetical protein